MLNVCFCLFIYLVTYFLYCFWCKAVIRKAFFFSQSLAYTPTRMGDDVKYITSSIQYRGKFLSFSPKAMHLCEGCLRAFGVSILVLTIKTTSECEVYIFQSKQANEEKCRSCFNMNQLTNANPLSSLAIRFQ